MDIPFHKMQGAGNDFIVINNQELKFSGEELSRLAKQICQRKRSVGSDALMALDTPQAEGDFRMRFYNADGTEAEMCGNGARCIARYAYEQGIADESMTIETVAGDVKAWRLDKRRYKVQLNAPTYTKFDWDFADDPENVVKKVDYVELGDPAIPHLVVHYPGLADKPLTELQELAKKLRFWDKLPKGANVNFYDEMANGELLVRTFERGVEDFTLACGTGSGSVAYSVTAKEKATKSPVILQVLGGTLEVAVNDQELYLMGDTNIIVKGLVTDEDLPDLFPEV
ncbi:diaminopimelate epimerase [Enterococcus mediterraneensis]|uniref:diaminopimelate epimerase n=1 Tax=Enterococcus mediterraneensis TaxID=2364791 RepID=UPI000F04E0BE|nr:diaminopimelate epimerase [Enterococcus mediterraneensis]